MSDNDGRRTQELLNRLRTSLPEEERRGCLAELKQVVREQLSDDVSAHLATLEDALLTTPNDCVRTLCLAVADVIAEHSRTCATETAACTRLIRASAASLQHLTRRNGGDDLSAARTINSVLKLLQSVFDGAQAVVLSSLEVTEATQALVAACRWATRGAPSKRGVTRLPRSGSTTARFQQQQMGNWRPESSQVDHTGFMRKRASNASLRSADASSDAGASVTTAGMSDPGSEGQSEVDDAQSSTQPQDRSKRAEELRRSIRARVVACFSVWSKRAPRQLTAHLFTLIADPAADSAHGAFRGAGSQHAGVLLQLLEDDPGLSVRIEAAHCLRSLLTAAQRSGYLQIADERAGKTRSYAFTSLSSRVAGMLVTLRSGVAQALLHCLATQKPAKLISALLDLARALVEAVEDSRLLQKHHEVLAPALVALSKHNEPSLALLAHNILQELGASLNASKIPPTGLPNIDLAALVHDVKSESAHITQEAWSLALEVVKAGTVLPQDVRLALLEAATRAVASNTEGVCLASTRFIQTIAPDAARHAPSLLCQILQPLAISRSPAVRLLGAQIMFDAISCLAEEQLHNLTSSAATLLQDSDCEVQATAYRSLGQVAQQNANESPARLGFLLPLMGARVKALSSFQEEIRVQASWAFANLCEYASPGDLRNWDAWISCATSCSVLDVRTSTNAIRASGALLKMATEDQLAQPASTDAFRAIIGQLSGQTPKAQWNAASAVERTFANPHAAVLLETSRLRDQCVAALESNLVANNHKVQLSNAKALLRICRLTPLKSESIDTIRASVTRALEKLEGAAGSRADASGQGKKALEALSTQLSAMTLNSR